VSGLQHANHVARLHALAFCDERLDGFDRCQYLALSNRDDGPVDDDSGEVNDPAHDRDDRHSVRDSAQVNPSMPDTIGRRRSDKVPHDNPWSVDGPHPPVDRFRRERACRRDLAVKLRGVVRGGRGG
jgi:hypothetical protein